MAGEPGPVVSRGARFGAVLASYLRAGTPLLAIQTDEEDRALDRLSALARDLGRGLHVGPAETLSDGWQACFDAWLALEEPAIFVAIDLHPLLGDPRFVRALRVMATTLESRDQSLILVAPELAIPRDLEREVVVLDMPLPDSASLRRLAAVEGQRRGVRLPEDVLDAAVRTLQGLTSRAAQRSLRRAFEMEPGLAQGCLTSLIADKRALLSGADDMEMIDDPPSLDDLGGLDVLKRWLSDRETAFGEEAAKFGLPSPRGLLLVGVHGCGKSLTAKAVAHHWNLPLVRLEFGALFGTGGSPEAALRRVQRLSAAMAPVVLWIDEIDKAFGALGPGGSSDRATVERLFAGFVTWLQERDEPVFVVATANAVEHLPPELLRKGRFDEVFFVDLPTAVERAQVLTVHLAAKDRAPEDFDLKALSEQAEFFTGAELEAVVTSGLFRAFKRGGELTTEDLSVAIDQTVPLYRTYEEPIKALRAWAKSRARRASTDLRLTELWTRAS
jgi:hypothetical protein